MSSVALSVCAKPRKTGELVSSFALSGYVVLTESEKYLRSGEICCVVSVCYADRLRKIGGLVRSVALPVCVVLTY